MENNKVIVFKEEEMLGKKVNFYGSIEQPIFMVNEIKEWIEYEGKSGQLLKSSGVEDEDMVRNLVYSLASKQNRLMWFVTEDGLYDILMASQKHKAKEFKKMIKHILKTIRLTGGYVNDTEKFVDEYLGFLNNEDKRLFNIKILEKVKEQEVKIIHLDNKFHKTWKKNAGKTGGLTTAKNHWKKKAIKLKEENIELKEEIKALEGGN